MSEMELIVPSYIENMRESIAASIADTTTTAAATNTTTADAVASTTTAVTTTDNDNNIVATDADANPIRNNQSYVSSDFLFKNIVKRLKDFKNSDVYEIAGKIMKDIIIYTKCNANLHRMDVCRSENDLKKFLLKGVVTNKEAFVKSVFVIDRFFNYSPLLTALSYKRFNNYTNYIICRLFMYAKMRKNKNKSLGCKEMCVYDTLNVAKIARMIISNADLDEDSKTKLTDMDIINMNDIFNYRSFTPFFPNGNELEATSSFVKKFKFRCLSSSFEQHENSLLCIRKSYIYYDLLMGFRIILRKDYGITDLSEKLDLHNLYNCDSINVKHIYDKYKLKSSSAFRTFIIKRSFEYIIPKYNYQECDIVGKNITKDTKTKISIDTYYKFDNFVVLRVSIRLSNCRAAEKHTDYDAEISIECEYPGLHLEFIDHLSIVLYGYFAWQLVAFKKITDYDINTNYEVFRSYCMYVCNDDVSKQLLESVYDKFKIMLYKDVNNNQQSCSLDADTLFTEEDFIRLMRVLKDENEEKTYEFVDKLSVEKKHSIEELYNYNILAGQCIDFLQNNETIYCRKNMY